MQYMLRSYQFGHLFMTSRRVAVRYWRRGGRGDDGTEEDRDTWIVGGIIQ
jgi:hypothetical protein